MGFFCLNGICTTRRSGKRLSDGAKKKIIKERDQANNQAKKRNAPKPQLGKASPNNVGGESPENKEVVNSKQVKVINVEATTPQKMPNVPRQLSFLPDKPDEESFIGDDKKLK